MQVGPPHFFMMVIFSIAGTLFVLCFSVPFVIVLRPRFVMRLCEKVWKIARSIELGREVSRTRPQARQVASTQPPPVHPHQASVASALVNLGCKKKDAAEIARTVCQGSSAALEDLIRQAVQRASRG